MVNNIVYFGRIIATILLAPLSRHSRATLVPFQSLKSLWTLETLETLSLSGGLLVFQIRCKDNTIFILVFL